MDEDSVITRGMEPIMDYNQRGLVDACFEEGQFDSGIRVLEQLRSSDHRPSPHHLRQLLYIALYPPDTEKPLAAQPPGSPSKIDKKRQKAFLKISPEISAAAQKALHAFAQSNSLEAIFAALPSSATSPTETGSSGAFSQVSQEAERIIQCKSCWNFLEKDFIETPALQESRQERLRRMTAGESDEEDSSDMIAEHAWPVLEWLLSLFERDELRTEAEGIPRHSPLLLNQIPQPKGNRNLRWEVETPLNIIFACIEGDDERHRLLGTKLLTMIVNLACTSYFDFQAFVISVYKRVSTQISDEFLSLLSSLPPTTPVLRFKVALLQKYIGPSTSTKAAPRPKPQARAVPKRGRNAPVPSETPAPPPDSVVASIATKPSLPPFADISQALEKPQKSRSPNAAVKFEFLVSYGTLQSQISAKDDTAEWAEVLRSGRWQRLLDVSFTDESSRDYRDTLSFLVPPY